MQLVAVEIEQVEIECRRATLRSLVLDDPSQLPILNNQMVDGHARDYTREAGLVLSTQLAAEIAEGAPLAVRSTRMTLRRGLADAVKAQTDHEFSEQSWLMRTEDHREGVRAVAERRQGRFIGG